MIIPGADRTKRHHSASPEDQRNPYQRDRDRILYSSAFRRLAGITQIVRAGEADVFHTRLTHTLKVAQVGRRIAEYVIATQTAEALTLGIDAEVVEGACLAHDLGHPPFGHLGEKALNELVINSGDEDGFEGNAQSFRILTKLAVRFRGMRRSRPNSGHPCSLHKIPVEATGQTSHEIQEMGLLRRRPR